MSEARQLLAMAKMVLADLDDKWVVIRRPSTKSSPRRRAEVLVRGGRWKKAPVDVSEVQLFGSKVAANEIMQVASPFPLAVARGWVEY